MKKIILGFVIGLLVGIAPHVFSLYRAVKPSSVELALGQMVCQSLHDYKEDMDIDIVFSLAKDFWRGKRALKEAKDFYLPLVEVAEKKAEEEIRLVLKKIDHFLYTLQENPNIKAVVPERVYMEVLQEGNGEVVTGADIVKIYYKEYAEDGSLIKNTGHKAYTLPLSQTIKGFKLGLEGAKIGETRKLYIHPEYGFSKMGGKAEVKPLIYEVTLLEKKRS